jgi:hypothetical protein
MVIKIGSKNHICVLESMLGPVQENESISKHGGAMIRPQTWSSIIFLLPKKCNQTTKNMKFGMVHSYGI